MTIVSKDWRLGPDTNSLDYSCSASIAAHGVAKIVDKGILVRLNSVRNFQWSGSYRVADESFPDDLLYDNFEDTRWTRGAVEEYARGNSSGIWRHLCVRQHCDQSGSGDWDVCDARSLPGRVLRYRPYQAVSCFEPLTGTPILSV